MPETVHILVGTMTGTAEQVALEVEDVLTNAGLDVELLMMDTLDATVFEDDGVFLICTSTYGQGDVPDNAQDFLASLKSERPDLSAVSYGLIALGDKTYRKTFCRGGQLFDEALTELGAVRIGESLKCNASSGEMPEELAVEWAQGWITLLQARRRSAA